MAQRGRKSIEALTILQGGLSAMPQRPDAPYDLADEEAEEWRAIVNTMSPDHFMRAAIIQFSVNFAGTSWRLAGLPR
jgi:hypothetical protein